MLSFTTCWSFPLKAWVDLMCIYEQDPCHYKPVQIVSSLKIFPRPAKSLWLIVGFGKNHTLLTYEEVLDGYHF